MAGSTILGGDGADTMQLGQGVIAYGGAGDDRIETFGNSVLYGNAGDDILVAQAGSNVIFPGAGRDEVHTGTGDDVVVVFDACEIMSGEVIDLGEGHDVVISPLTRQELLARGVTLVGVEEVQVQGDPCKAECRNPPACVSAGVCTVNADQSLGCTCPPWAEGYRCEIPKDLPFNSTPPPALDGVDEGTRLQQATAFLRWFMNGTNSDRGATRTLLDGTRGNLKIRAAFAAAGREYLHSASADAQVVAIEILGYLQCRDCIEVLIEAFPTTVPNVPVGFHGGDPKSTARAVQSLLAFELAGAGLLRTKTFLLEHLARHEDEFVRRSIVFAMKQAYGESIRSSVAAVARQEDMVAFDWVSNADPDFNSKLRARYNH